MSRTVHVVPRTHWDRACHDLFAATQGHHLGDQIGTLRLDAIVTTGSGRLDA